MNEATRIGIGGPVGSGKTRLVERLLPMFAASGIDIAVITNDLVTDEDAQRVRRSGLIDPARVTGVETGACPHTAIREDPSANLSAVMTLQKTMMLVSTRHLRRGWSPASSATLSLPSA